ncbi:hypothetical protein BC826DRAFT_692075 [Russula brevipes]|nr:hypothetical protein BC826DRAFT_692075 [Russula brevipes]
MHKITGCLCVCVCTLIDHKVGRSSSSSKNSLPRVLTRGGDPHQHAYTPPCRSGLAGAPARHAQSFSRICFRCRLARMFKTLFTPSNAPLERQIPPSGFVIAPSHGVVRVWSGLV